jgi:hypothetical protein
MAHFRHKAGVNLEESSDHPVLGEIRDVCPGTIGTMSLAHATHFR